MYLSPCGALYILKASEKTFMDQRSITYKYSQPKGLFKDICAFFELVDDNGIS